MKSAALWWRFKNVALGSWILVLMTTLSWDSEVCFDHPWGIISASECENIFRHFAKQLLRKSLVEQIHRIGNKLWSASREYDSSRWLCMQVKTASISSESNPNQCNHPAENDSFSPRIEKQSSSRLVLLGLIPLKHKLGWAIVCIIICSLFFLNFCLPRKLENCSNRAIDWLLSNEASQVKTAPISEPSSPLPLSFVFSKPSVLSW